MTTTTHARSSSLSSFFAEPASQNGSDWIDRLEVKQLLRENVKKLSLLAVRAACAISIVERRRPRRAFTHKTWHEGLSFPIDY